MTAVQGRHALRPVVGTPETRRPVRWVGPALAVTAIVCWVVGFRPVDPTTIGSFGLLPRLSPILVLAYPLLVAAFVVELRTGRTAVLTGITVLAVFAVYGLQPAAEPAGRLPVAWLHTGFADYINAHGAVLPNFDTRFSWPGFFALLALLIGASGLKDGSALIIWAPVVLSGGAVLAVRAIALAVFRRDRIAWLAAWIFLAGNWTEQDYLSPQGSSYLLLLAGLAVTFRYLSSVGPVDPIHKGQFRRPAVPAGSARDRLVALGLVVLLAIALAPTHQLSPYMLAGLLFVLASCGRLWARWLPVAVLLAAVVWFVLGARDFWIGQLHIITGSLGDLGSSVNDGLDKRLSANLGRESMLGVRIGLTCAVGALAGIGAIVLRRQGKRSLTLVLMAVAAFGLAVAQPYGGEILIRCYLFALPLFALLGAVVLDALAGTRAWAVVAVGLAGLMLAVVTARGGNDAYVAFTRADIAVAQQAYARAGTGQRIDTVAAYAPVSDWQRIGAVKQASLESSCVPFPDPQRCVLAAHPDFLVLNAAQDAYGRIYYGMPSGWTTALADQLVASGKYQRVFRQDSSQLLELSSDVGR
ncbi:MAG TPA: hypothetical protein VG756_15580 [Pseudonocardiaceae bacterium]|jgi:hypothetical protein|nr:hypothetical protein [Pseudonocardiaceae bacterium]